ncbi:MAG TPA: SDR family oxidoreductase [Dehalococcoidia bacterium]|nr:SDR family oxidoreductase [Dehalococcoidia bacterium]
MDLGLQGRVAIVTGGSEGIGYATAAALLGEGVAVSICARRPDKLAQAAEELRARMGGRLEAISADVSSPEEIGPFVRETERRLGPVDILINNAASFQVGGTSELRDEDWLYHLNVKLLAYVRFVRLVSPGMRSRGWGRIINVGGAAARQVTGAGGTAGPVNAAIMNYTKNIATEMAPDGVIVNLIHPGATRTHRHEINVNRRIEREGISFDQAERETVKGIPTGRMIEPADCADLIVFLASDRAASIAGQAISVDGGAARGVFY